VAQRNVRHSANVRGKSESRSEVETEIFNFLGPWNVLIFKTDVWGQYRPTFRKKDSFSFSRVDLESPFIEIDLKLGYCQAKSTNNRIHSPRLRKECRVVGVE
jgi:hypothetical protein